MDVYGPQAFKCGQKLSLTLTAGLWFENPDSKEPQMAVSTSI
jgi:hypothetical protein